MSDRPRRALDDWLRMHRALLEQERNFAQLAQAYAAGCASEGEVNARRQLLAAMRELGDVVFDEALKQLRNYDPR